MADDQTAKEGHQGGGRMTKSQREQKFAELQALMIKGASREDAAKQVGVSYATASNWLRKARSAEPAALKVIELTKGQVKVTIEMPSKSEMTQSELISALTSDPDIQRMIRDALALGSRFSNS
jgi:transposase